MPLCPPFTMQTQMDLVVEHSSHIIMNIDVLSFGRLTHRILEEVGCEDVPVLDDTGKRPAGSAPVSPGSGSA